MNGLFRAFQVDGDEESPALPRLTSSRELGWSNISAELRSHPRGIIASCSGGDTELMLLLRGRARITRMADGIRQTSEAAPGMLWLTPAGTGENLMETSNPLPEALHVFLPATQFSSRAATGRTVHQYLITMRLGIALRTCSAGRDRFHMGARFDRCAIGEQTTAPAEKRLACVGRHHSAFIEIASPR
jgi:hypothetical protein